MFGGALLLPADHCGTLSHLFQPGASVSVRDERPDGWPTCLDSSLASFLLTPLLGRELEAVATRGGVDEAHGTSFLM